MKNSKIGWTDHTVNFWWGCTKVSPACTHCYAESIAKAKSNRLFGFPVKWGPGQPRGQRLEAARKEALALNRKAAKESIRFRVFVNSMSDWLDEEAPLEWLAALLDIIVLCPSLDFQLLTKRPENWKPRMMAVAAMDRMASHAGHLLAMRWARNSKEFNDVPSNVMVGVTVEDQVRANLRISKLLQIPAKVRFLSMEPLLSEVSLSSVPAIDDESGWGRLFPLRGGYHGEGMNEPYFPPNFPKIHWVIAGGESGANRLSHPDWYRSLLKQCLDAGVPFYFKQWGDWMPFEHAPAEALKLKMRGRWLAQDGSDKLTKCNADDILMVRLGAKNTGNMLDGRQWEEFPKQ